MKLQVGVKALIKQDDTFLFLRRSSSFEAESQDWDIPGGRIDSEENLLEALNREVLEETGLTDTSVGMLLAAQDIFVTHKDLHVVRLTYQATAKGNVVISSEHDEYAWMSLKQVINEPHVDKYLRQVLEKL